MKIARFSNYIQEKMHPETCTNIYLVPNVESVSRKKNCTIRILFKAININMHIIDILFNQSDQLS